MNSFKLHNVFIIHF